MDHDRPARAARLEGFSLHADVAVPARRRDQLEEILAQATTRRLAWHRSWCWAMVEWRTRATGVLETYLASPGRGRIDGKAERSL
jgi:hypothetical protein